MAKEIERKFLVREEILIPILQDEKILRTKISQFYLVATPDVAVRLRKSPDSDEPVVLAVKHGGNLISTNEHEFPVSFESYDERLSDRVGHEIVKTRHFVWHGDREWEVDVFEGELDGLIVAELECDDAADVTDLPEWVGEEVTFDRRYKNAVLALNGRPQDVLESLRQLDRDLSAKLSPPVLLDGVILDYMSGSDETAARELRTRTLNPFSTEANGARQAEMKAGHAASPERQKAFEEAMSRVVRANPDHIMRADPPFDIFEKPTDGLTEGLMFAPGDAVFTEAASVDPIPAVATADEQPPEMMAALRFADALRNAGEDVVLMLNDLADSVLTSFAIGDERNAVEAVKYDDAERSAAQRLIEALRAADVEAALLLDDLTKCIENPSSGNELLLLAALAEQATSHESTIEGNASVPEEGELLHVANSGHVVSVSPHAAGVAEAFSGISGELEATFMQATENHRYIDQSQEFILIGEVTDEGSSELLKRAAAEGHKPFTGKED